MKKGHKIHKTVELPMAMIKYSFKYWESKCLLKILTEVKCEKKPIEDICVASVKLKKIMLR